MYMCKKSTKLGGIQYHPGDTIPDEAVLPERVRTLTMFGKIVKLKKASDTASHSTSKTLKKVADKQNTTKAEKKDAEDSKQATNNSTKGKSATKTQEGDA